MVATATVLVAMVALVIAPGVFPVGIVAQGLVSGATTGLLALGLVLTYQSSRVVNFAQGAFGSIGAAVGVSLYLGPGWPWWAALVVGTVVGGAAGALSDVLIVRRFASSSRLTLTVATVGLAQLLGGMSLLVPGWLNAPPLVAAFDTGLSDISFRLRPVLFTGNEVLMATLVPVAVLGLGWFLRRTDWGRAVRAAAENRDRARLLAVPVRRLSTLVWATSGALASVTVLLSAPSQGLSNGLGSAPVVLLPALAAAVVARMSSLGVAFATAACLGVVDSLVRWHVEAKSVTTVVFLAVIVVALLVRPQQARDDDSEDGITAPPPAPSHAAAESDRRRTWTTRAPLVLGGVAVAALPLALDSSDLLLFSVGVLDAMVVVSLVLLTGWAGQISLGQVALVGVGGVVTANLVLDHNLDLFWALTAAGGAAALVAVLIGLPALRIRGPFLAVTTLAFAVAADSYAFNLANFETWLPFSLDRPVLFDRVDLASEMTYAYLCLALLAVTVVLVAGLRNGRPGRSVIATRANPRAAAAMAVPGGRVKLTTFVFAGAVAGVAGGLHVHLLGGIGEKTYPPSASLTVFAMAVIGGIESLPGALAGVTAVHLIGWLFPTYEVVLTGVGMLVLLLVVPGGLAEIGRRTAAIGTRRPGPQAATSGRDGGPAPAGAPSPTDPQDEAPPLLRCERLDVSYGPLQVLFGVDLAVEPGEVVALLGTNGAGKSTVLKAICGLLPSVGVVNFDGRSLQGRSPEEIAQTGIAMVPGGRGVFPTLSVEDNLRVAAWAFRRDEVRVAAGRQRVLALFPALATRLDQPAGTLSGGEQQMLVLAQAFLGEPRLLLIDELSLGLAPAVVAELLDVVRRQARAGTTVVLVEQSVNVALTIAERAVFLEKGEVRFVGPTSDLLDRPDVLHSVFLGGSQATRPSVPLVERGGEIVLSCQGLGKRFGGVVAVDDVDLELRRGQVLGMIGHNGAGKTTLFDLVSGFLVADAGRVVLDGTDITDLGPSDRARRGLARSFQEARLFPGLDVVETLAVALDRHLAGRGDGFVAAALRLPAATDTERIVRERVDELIDQLGLGPYAGTPIAHLSTGTRRIVELGCMLGARPDVLLLDEPSAGVAQRETEHLGPLLRRVQQDTGCSIVIIEHDMALLSAVCDNLVALEYGSVIATGPPHEVLDHPRVRASYLGTNEAVVARSGAVPVNVR